MKKYEKFKHVVIFCPLKNNKILMQLRDNKKDIVFPNQWGYFSGSIEKGEMFVDTLRREVKEELDIPISRFNSYFFHKFIDNHLKIISYCFILNMKKINKFKLLEGSDCIYISKEQIKLNKVYSFRTKKYHSIIKADFMKKLFTEVLNNYKGL